MKLVIFDSFSIAGDNGEYFYRRVRELYPDIKMTFLLSQQSPDFNRLKKDDFCVVPFDSNRSSYEVRCSDFVLFSKNCGGYSISENHRYKTIFLQHGVTARIYNDSKYLNDIIGKQARYICCSSKEEMKLIKEYTNGRLIPIPTGFPRHDFLLEKCRRFSAMDRPKRIFINFHWRMGECDRSKTEFLRSSYLKDINQMLNSKEIHQLTNDGVEVIFFPHARFMKYINLFKIPSYVKVPIKMQFQDVLASSDILVTDFSSNTFEMAYMNKPTMVYVPGIEYVRQNLPFYKIENIGRYNHLIYCDSLKKLFGEIKQKLMNNGNFSVANELFLNVDTNNTQRLVEWMLNQIEQQKKHGVDSKPNLNGQKQQPKDFRRFQFG